MSEAPYRIQFDNARDPLTARNALGIDSVLAGYLTAAFAATTYATKANFPATAWTSWTPAISAGVGTITSTTINYAKYIQLGKTVIAQVDITITNAGTGAGAFLFGLPIAAIAGAGLGLTAFGREVAVNGKVLGGSSFSATTIGLAYYDNTSAIATTNQLCATVIYEVA